MSDELTPITRKETFLAKAGGQNVVTPTPITREETFLQAIIDNGSGGGGGGVLVVNIDGQTMALDKTYNEIKNAPFAVFKMTMMEGLDLWNTPYQFDSGVGEAGKYRIYVFAIEEGSLVSYKFTANSADGYPVMDMG